MHTIEEKIQIITNVMHDFIPFHKILGVKMLEVRDGYAKMLIPFKEELIGDPRAQRWHGGVISAGMDAIGGAAGMTSLTSYEDQMSTIDIRIDYLRGTKPKDLIIEGEVVRSGNKVVATKMSASHPDEEEPVAEGRAVYNVRRKNTDA